MLAPVVVFAYNRDTHLKRTLDALQKNRLAKETNVYIFVDGPKTEKDKEKVRLVQEVTKQYINTDLFKNVIVEFSDKNKGLADSIIGGVTKVIKKEKKVIVLEDDLLTAPDFLEYMNQGLEYYQNDKNVGAISGFCPALRRKMKDKKGIYKSRTGNSCGWATWENVWLDADWHVKDYDAFVKDKKMQKSFNRIQYGISDILIRQMRGELSSWAVRWDYYFWKNSLWTIYPVKSHIENIGFDGKGTTSNNLWDRRRKITAVESRYVYTKFEDLEDLTRETANSFKPGILEILYDIIKK